VHQSAQTTVLVDFLARLPSALAPTIELTKIKGMEKSREKSVNYKTELEESCGQISILNLPVELLVYIASFLATMRDKVKLRYVSQKLRAISETPSLWRVFVWPYYDCREEGSLIKSLKPCRRFIKKLDFPDHVAPPTLFKMLEQCNRS